MILFQFNLELIQTPKCIKFPLNPAWTSSTPSLDFKEGEGVANQFVMYNDNLQPKYIYIHESWLPYFSIIQSWIVKPYETEVNLLTLSIIIGRLPNSLTYPANTT